MIPAATARALALATAGAPPEPEPEPAPLAEPAPPIGPAPQVELPPPPPEPSYVIPVLHDLALLTGVRVVETFLWPDPFARPETWGHHYEEAYTKPPVFHTDRAFFEWDGDPWPINLVGHALMGSELYMRPRTCRVPWYGALAFAAGGTVLWEYGFEANGSRPSGLDLVWTPLAGIALGELRYVTWRAAGTLESKTGRAVVRAVVDPFGEVERALGARC